MKTGPKMLMSIHSADYSFVKTSPLHLKQRQQQIFKQPHSLDSSQVCLRPTLLRTVIDSLERKRYLRETEEP